MEQTNKIKYDLNFTDIYGNIHRIIKNSEPIEDEEGLQDLIDGFVNLLKLSGWTWIEDLDIVKDCDCDSIVEYEELIKYISKKTEIDEETIRKIKELEIEYLVDNGYID